jgi:transcriptional regulator with XRE-family HTH domain
VDAATILRSARRRAHLSLRQLARQAGTSHSTLSAYESGRVAPSVATVDRILRAAGFAGAVELAPVMDGRDRGAELVEVLELAAMFPARHAEALEFPRFGARY